MPRRTHTSRRRSRRSAQRAKGLLVSEYNIRRTFSATQPPDQDCRTRARALTWSRIICATGANSGSRMFHRDHARDDILPLPTRLVCSMHGRGRSPLRRLGHSSRCPDMKIRIACGLCRLGMRVSAVGAILIILNDGMPHVFEVRAVHPANPGVAEEEVEIQHGRHAAPIGAPVRSGLRTNAS